jgi:hypothetical protein
LEAPAPLNDATLRAYYGKSKSAWNFIVLYSSRLRIDLNFNSMKFRF